MNGEGKGASQGQGDQVQEQTNDQRGTCKVTNRSLEKGSETGQGPKKTGMELGINFPKINLNFKVSRTHL